MDQKGLAHMKVAQLEIRPSGFSPSVHKPFFLQSATMVSHAFRTSYYISDYAQIISIEWLTIMKGLIGMIVTTGTKLLNIKAAAANMVTELPPVMPVAVPAITMVL